MTKVKILVPISGGKDSQATLELALAHHPKEVVRGLFCDTGFEHPETYAHIERMRHMYGIRIDTVSEGTVEEKCLKHGRFPGGGARHCTDELKIVPTKKYCKALAIEQGGFEVWYGMRSDESAQRKKRYMGKVSDELYPPHEVLPKKYPKYLAKMGVMFRLAILEWSRADVMEFLDGRQHPFYALGFDRIGCFPCMAGGDKSKEKAFNHDDFGRSQWQKMIVVSGVINKSIWTSNGGAERNDIFGGCALCAI